MSRGTIDFYFDIVSPFSYLAFEALLQFEKQLPLKINFKPVSIVSVFQSSENKSPVLCPPKARYNYYDIPRVAKYWNVPFKNVTNFPERILKNSTSKVQHFLVAVNMHQPNDLRRLMRAFWRRLYLNDGDIFSENDVREVCREEQIANAERLIELSKSEPVKQTYKETTNEAIKSGAFGVPFMLVKVDGQKSETMFGTDRLHILFHQMGISFSGPLELAKL